MRARPGPSSRRRIPTVLCIRPLSNFPGSEAPWRRDATATSRSVPSVVGLHGPGEVGPHLVEFLPEVLLGWIPSAQT